VVNLTNHSYFNLAGVKEASQVLDHVVQLNAHSWTEVDDDAIPTGQLSPVQDTAMDFREPRRIGERIEQVQGGGYDHNYAVWTENKPTEKCFVARVSEPISGRCIEVWSTQPGVQLFTSNPAEVTEGIKGKNDVVYPVHAGICFETQHFPDSPNNPTFPSTVLAPGEAYQESCSYRFSVQK